MKLSLTEWMVVAAILVVVIAFLAPASAVTRSFFSPDTLESKYQTEQIWGAGIPVYRSGFKKKTSALVDYLVENGFWSATNSDNPAWIMTGCFSSQWKDGQSHLHTALYWHEEEWIAWTKAHPELARVAWPRVLAELRDDESRGNAEELLFLAKDAKSVEEFEQLAAEPGRR